MPLADYEIFLLGDQPTTCPHCGSRTEYEDVADRAIPTQLHTCPNTTCGFVFLAEEDVDPVDDGGEYDDSEG